MLVLQWMKMKENIQENVPGLSFIQLLHPVTYKLDIHKQMAIMGNKKNITPWEGMYEIEKIRMTGFLAQDVLEAARSIGYDFSGVDVPKDGGLNSIRYGEFVVPLVKAVQELYAENNKLKILLADKNNVLQQITEKNRNELQIQIDQLKELLKKQ